MNKAELYKAFGLYGRGRALAIAKLEMTTRPDAARHLRWLMLWERINHELNWLALNEEAQGIALLLSESSARTVLLPRLCRSNATGELGRVTINFHQVSIRKAREFYNSASFKMDDLLKQQLKISAAVKAKRRSNN